MAAFVFSTFEVPGQLAGSGASVGGINDLGQIAGTFTDSSGRARVFVRTGGHYDTVLVSQEDTGLTVTGLNNLDLIVGTTNPAFADTDVLTQQFDPFTNQFGPPQTYVSPFPNYPMTGGVNDLGEVIGSSELLTPSSTTPGTSFIEKNGTFTALQTPLSANAYATVAAAINDLGQITGFDDTITGPSYNPQLGSVGFVDTNGTIKTIVAIPGIPFTEPTAINNLGEVAGNASGDQYTFVGFVDIAGKITILEYPGASSTVVTGINDFGQIVGQYYYDNGVGIQTGGGPFVATPVPSADQ